MKATNRKFNIIILIGLFLILYNPPFFPFNTMHIVGFCSLIYISLYFSYLSKTVHASKLINLMGCFLIILCYSSVKSLLQELSLNSIVFPVYYLLDVIPFGLSVSIYSKKNKLTIRDFLDMVLFVSVMQAVLAIAAFLIPSVKSLFVNMLLSRGYGDVYAILASHRMYGLSGGLTYSTPILQSFLALVAAYLAFAYSKKYLICAIVLAFSAIINARTAFIVLLVGGIVLLFFSSLDLKKKIGILLWIAVISVIIGQFLIPILMELAPETFRWVSDGFNEIVRFLSGNTVGYFSYATSKSHYQLPSGLSLFFGVGHIIMGGYQGVSSDVGYINDIWYGGFIYIAMLYPFFLRMMWSIYKSKEKVISFLGMCFLLLYPALNIKGIAFSMNDFSNFLVLTYIMAVLRQDSTQANGIKGDFNYA